MRTLGWLVLLSPMLAEAGGRVAPAGPAAEAKLEGIVLVWADAGLILDPKAPKQTVKLAKLPRGRKAYLGAAVAMKVVSTQGELVELDPAAGMHCTLASFDAPLLENVRLFVQRKDLAPVITTAFSKAYDDGTRIEIAPGTPVIELSDHAYVTRIGSQEIPVDIPAANIGHAYQPAPLAPVTVADTGPVLKLKPGIRARLGARTFTTAKKPFVEIERGIVDKDGKRLYPLDPEGACTRAVIAIARSQTEGVNQASSAGIGVTGATGTRGQHIPKGTKVETLSGYSFAVAAANLFVTTTKPKACADVPARLDLVRVATANATGTPAKLRACAPAGTQLLEPAPADTGMPEL